MRWPWSKREQEIWRPAVICDVDGCENIATNFYGLSGPNSPQREFYRCGEHAFSGRVWALMKKADSVRGGYETRSEVEITNFGRQTREFRSHGELRGH